MLEKALLLTGELSPGDDKKAERLLEFFGVSLQVRSAKDLGPVTGKGTGDETSYRLMCAAETFAAIIGDLQNPSNGATEFGTRVHSIFLYSGGDAAATAKVASQLCETPISIGKEPDGETEWLITDDSDSMFGAMRGLGVRLAPATPIGADLFVTNQNSHHALISARNKAAFLKTTWNGVPIFISSEPLIDIDAEVSTPNFDVRDHFFSAVPVVSYIRWAFSRSSWSAPEASACLVIDDPLLRTRYGFLRFRELLALMKQVRFSTSIAFIPWNWRRSDPKVVQLFKDNPDNYSLCVHGCDHTGGEFGISDQRRLRAIAREAVRRMSLHEGRTGLTHDRIMVFPQGVFSEEAILELKHASFHAVVNTEVHSNQLGRRKLRISDLWDVAVMTYGDFPIYTRRYPAQGIENLAFDLLLGKPCLVVIHHDYCSNGYARLARFIRKLNALKVALVWQSLAEVVKRGYRQKEISADCVEIEMYGAEVQIQNRSQRRMNYLVRRRERKPDSIEGVYSGAQPVAWNSPGNHIEFKVDLAPGASTLVRLHFKVGENPGRERQNVVHSAKTLLRRYLSEARDNYLMPAKARIAASSRS